MSVYDMAQLDASLIANNFGGVGQNIRDQIESYLHAAGFQSDVNDPHSPPFIDVEIIATQTTWSPTANFLWFLNDARGPNPQVTTNADLHYIFEGTPGKDLSVLGGAHDVGISLSGENFLTLADAGNDVVWANGGHNTIDAAASTGTDIFYASFAPTPGLPSGGDEIYGGAGVGNKIIEFGGGYFQSGSVSTGGSYTELFAYSVSGATLQGGAGADTLYANGSSADLRLGSGDNQWAQAFAGDSTLEGGSGNNQTLFTKSTGFTVMEGGTGNNNLDAAAGAGSGTMTSGSTSALGSYNTLVNESLSDWTMTAGAGKDTLTSSGGGSDKLYSGTGDVHQLLADYDAGDDLLVAQNAGGFVTLKAGAGNDTLDGSGAQGDNLFYIGTGNETVLGGTGHDYFQDLTSTGAAGSSSFVINITGDANDTLNFDNRTLADIAPGGDTSSGGIRTIQFSDGQEYKISDTINVTFIHTP